MTTLRPVRELVLVFNADSGRINAWLDSARKLFGAGECSLCDITHGLAGEKQDWVSCRTDLGIPVAALHRDELGDAHRVAVDGQFPCVLARTDEGYERLLGPDVLSRCRGSVADFRGRLLTHAALQDLSMPMAV